MVTCDIVLRRANLLFLIGLLVLPLFALSLSSVSLHVLAQEAFPHNIFASINQAPKKMGR